MKDYQLPQKTTLLERLHERPNEDPLFMNIVTGPRRTGKTTLVHQVLRETHKPSRYLSAERPTSDSFPSRPISSWRGPDDPLESVAPSDVRYRQWWLVLQWEQAREDARRSENGFVLAIDEVQNIPNWAGLVKGLWDGNKRRRCNFHVILTGVAPLQYFRELSDRMVGRYEEIEVPHWSYAEMSAAFDFDLAHYIYFGGHPGIARYVEDIDRWSAYITETLLQPTFEQDIRSMERLRKHSLVKRLFDLGTERSGQVLSDEQVLDLHPSVRKRSTVTSYFDLLSSVGLMAGTEPFTTLDYLDTLRGFGLNVLSTAFLTVGSGYTFEEAQADRRYWGRLVKNAVGAHLLNTIGYVANIRYWREGDLEVDFVLTAAGRLLAIDVSVDSARSEARGREAFVRRFSNASSMVIGDGGVSVEEFLSIPAREWVRTRWMRS